MDEFLDDMDDEQVDDLLQPEEGEEKKTKHRRARCMSISVS